MHVWQNRERERERSRENRRDSYMILGKEDVDPIGEGMMGE